MPHASLVWAATRALSPPTENAPAVPQGVELVFDGTAMMDPMSLSDVAGIEAGKTVSIIMKRK